MVWWLWWILAGPASGIAWTIAQHSHIIEMYSWRTIYGCWLAIGACKVCIAIVSVWSECKSTFWTWDGWVSAFWMVWRIVWVLRILLKIEWNKWMRCDTIIARIREREHGRQNIPDLQLDNLHSMEYRKHVRLDWNADLVRKYVRLVFRCGTQNSACNRLRAPNILESDHRLADNLVRLHRHPRSRCLVRNRIGDLPDWRPIHRDKSEWWHATSSIGRIDSMYSAPATANTLRCVDIGNRWHLRATSTLHFRHRRDSCSGSGHGLPDRSGTRSNLRNSLRL